MRMPSYIIYGSLPEARRNIRKLRRLIIRVRGGIIGNKMAEFSLVAETLVRGYHAYMDQCEAAINTWREGVGRFK